MSVLGIVLQSLVDVSDGMRRSLSSMPVPLIFEAMMLILSRRMGKLNRTVVGKESTYGVNIFAELGGNVADKHMRYLLERSAIFRFQRTDNGNSKPLSDYEP
jgi:hypothetical protein